MNREDLIDLTCQLQDILANLNSVLHLVEDDRSCNQILRQIGAIRRSLRSLRCALILCQIRESTSAIRDNPDVEVRLRELTRLRELWREKIQTKSVSAQV